MAHHDHDRDRIERKAHELWEAEGRPHGRDREHWEQAREIIAIEDSQKSTLLPASTGAKEPDEPRLAVDSLGDVPGLTDQGKDDLTDTSREPAATAPKRPAARPKAAAAAAEAPRKGAVPAKPAVAAAKPATAVASKSAAAPSKTAAKTPAPPPKAPSAPETATSTPNASAASVANPTAQKPAAAAKSASKAKSASDGGKATSVTSAPVTDIVSGRAK